MESEWQNYPVQEGNATGPSVATQGKSLKIEQCPKPSLTCQSFPSLLPRLICLHQTARPPQEEDNLLPGRATIVPLKLAPSPWKKHIYPKSCQANPAFSYHLRRFLLDLSNFSEAHRLDTSARMIQQRHEPRRVQMLPSYCRGISSARQKSKHFASGNI